MTSPCPTCGAELLTDATGALFDAPYRRHACRPALAPGTRVRLSPEALAAGIGGRNPTREGVIAGGSRKAPGVLWSVRWDGVRTPSSYHRDFLEAVS